VRRSRVDSLIILSFVLAVGCGKKGAPLPPLVRIPAAPPDIAASRRGETVDVQLTVPATNTDGSRPANISRIEVYAVTGPPTLSDEDFVKYASRIGSLQVKAPRDPDDTVDPGEPEEEIEEPQGPGLDQGATVHVNEEITAAVLTAASAGEPDAFDGPVPLAGAPAVPSRTYAAAGVSTSGRRGPLSKRATVPLVSPPPAPAQPDVTWDESAVTISWLPIRAAVPEPNDGLLPSTPLVDTGQRSTSYNVYQVKPEERKLTTSPIADRRFVDTRIEWGAERCYSVRVVDNVGGLSVEGDAAPERCVRLEDRFPPAAPKGLQAIALEGAINLIWDANTERDLAGYIVMRGSSAESLAPITPSPVQASTFRDAVPAGSRGVYGVVAVDKAGNRSALSNVEGETAR
jgi:hypothetical protein